jgi:hypothetical protein
LIAEKMPLLPIAAAAAIATVAAQRAGKLRSLDEYPLVLRLENAVASYVAYLGKTLWPRDLAVLYPFSGLAAASRRSSRARRYS